MSDSCQTPRVKAVPARATAGSVFITLPDHLPVLLRQTMLLSRLSSQLLMRKFLAMIGIESWACSPCSPAKILCGFSIGFEITSSLKQVETHPGLILRGLNCSLNPKP